MGASICVKQSKGLSGLGSLDFPKKIFAGLGSLNQAFDRLREKNLQGRH